MLSSAAAAFGVQRKRKNAPCVLQGHPLTPASEGVTNWGGERVASYKGETWPRLPLGRPLETFPTTVCSECGPWENNQDGEGSHPSFCDRIVRPICNLVSNMVEQLGHCAA